MRGFPQSAILLQGNSIPHIEYTKSVFILGQHDTLGVAVHKSLLVGLVLKTTGHFTEVSRRPGSEQSLRAVGGTQKCRHVVHVVSFSTLNTFPFRSIPVHQYPIAIAAFSCPQSHIAKALWPWRTSWPSSPSRTPPTGFGSPVSCSIFRCGVLESSNSSADFDGISRQLLHYVFFF